ncbi:MAG: phosphoribosylamine--glycine ligase [Alphaproteobacteria bacterium]|nr:phosphoribosylamine--glycine ligase [Alphaproteobacteria bacterium]MBO6863814.1 phosphoribosylamine--glycine ligase [Alphaproteobacteria bacterium]
MRVLVIGSGGREHALCWAIAASPLLTKLYCAPGNAGIAREAECVAIGADDSDAILDFCKREKIDLVVVGPEAPLVAGLANRLRAEGIRTFGPDAAAAQLEGSKGFSKDICAKYNIPTAAYRRFTEAEAAKAYIREMGAPIVVKADGLAAGKGVTVAMTEEEAISAVDAAMTDGAFGAAGAELVIEECMVGEELSFFALADGETALPLASAQDHKRVGDGDTGPNTGGMGAYSPAPVCTPELERRIIDEILTPTVEAMKAEGAPFKGVLFIGLMITEEGPKVIEYNVRFGDPECQVLMMRLQSDILPALIATADGTLKNFDLRWQPKAAMTVVLASDGYPGTYQKGTVIRNVDGAEADPDVTVFHAGTARNDAGDLIATGGRVLNVTAVGDTVRAARDSAYAAVDLIQWPEGFCRRDIGHRALD